MENQEFNRILRSRNKQYREMFGYIPCITDYICTREQYMEALELSIRSGEKLEKYLIRYATPQSKRVEI